MTTKSTQETATKTETPNTPTPYIAVSATHYATGVSLQESRKNLVKVGGSANDEQTVYRLPDGAFGAFVAHDGNVYWYGVEGEMKPVYRYRNNKALGWGVGEDKPIPFRKVPKGAKPRTAEAAPESAETEQEAEIIATPTAPNKKTGKKGKKPAAEVAAESAQEPADGQPGGAPAVEVQPDAPKPKKGKKTKAESTPDLETQLEGSPTAAANQESWEKTTAPNKKAGKKAKPEVAKPEPANDEKAAAESTATEPADFLMFVGGAFYTKDAFIAEAKKLGISRRLPSHRLPKGLVCGKSRVFVAAEGVRKDTGSSSEVFGYFVPGAVEFISLGNGDKYADVIANLKLREDSRIIDSIDQEAERHCGFRKEGGTYLVVDKADTPLKLLKKVAHFEGNHFRGLMRLHPTMAASLETGDTVSVLIDEHCMNCGSPMKCSPDGHARAQRERRRIDKGEEPKWRLLDAKCLKELRKARAADDGVQSASASSDEVENGDEEDDAILGTD